MGALLLGIRRLGKANQADTSVLSRFSVSSMRPYDIVLWTLALA